jgi:deazaflavin-dependent oxidoreductase (nitroreductase family)
VSHRDQPDRPTKITIKLTTTGRQSGKFREVTLYAYPDGDDLVVVGSWGGAARDPAWARNLRDAPTARVRHGKRDVVVTAREAKGSERDRLWDLVTEAFPLYEAYQRKTDRVIPLFVLEPSVG